MYSGMSAYDAAFAAAASIRRISRGFQDRCLEPLGHPSVGVHISERTAECKPVAKPAPRKSTAVYRNH
jgi:hypothetical protein